VLDVGSGLGVDSFIAADAVGSTGSVTGRQLQLSPFRGLIQTVHCTSWFFCNQVFDDSRAICSLYLLVPLQSIF
jgi:hypothetical protein